MIMSVTGTPGSDHLRVGKTLADRLGLDYYSAQQFAKEYSKSNDYAYYLIKEHKSEDTDRYINERVKQVLEANVKESEHCLIDAFSMKGVDKVDKICIITNLLSDPLKAKTLRNENDLEKATAGDEKLYCFGPDGYDIVIHGMYINRNQCVDLVIDTIQSGIMKANYLHPFQCLPLYPKDIPNRPDDWIDESIVFDVCQVGYTYLLTNPTQYQQYLSYLFKGKVIKADITASSNVALPANAEYLWLEKLIPKECMELNMLALMLAKYCTTYEVTDYDQVYLDLSNDSNPYTKLMKAGFDS